MDISTLEKNLKQGEYTSIKAFVDDVNLIWKNCQQFNEKKSEIYVQSSRLRGTITKTLNEMGITQSVEGDKKSNNRKRDKSDSSVISTQSIKSFLNKKRKHSETKANKTEKDKDIPQNNKNDDIKKPQKENERVGRDLKKGEEKKEGKRDESKELGKKIIKDEAKRLRIVDDDETGGDDEKSDTPRIVDKKIFHPHKALNLRKEDEKGKSNGMKKKEYKPLHNHDHHSPINKQKINKREDIKQNITKNETKKAEESKDIRTLMNTLSEKRKETSHISFVKKGGESGNSAPKEKMKVHESIMSYDTNTTNNSFPKEKDKENEKAKDKSKEKEKEKEKETQSKTTPSCPSEQKTNSGICNLLNEKIKKCEKDNSSISSSKNSQDKENQQFPYVTDQDKFELSKISESLSDDDLVHFLVFVNSLDPKTIEELPGDALAIHFEKMEKDIFEKITKYAKTLLNKEEKPNNQLPPQINNENDCDQSKVEIVSNS